MINFSIITTEKTKMKPVIVKAMLPLLFFFFFLLRYCDVLSSLVNLCIYLGSEETHLNVWDESQVSVRHHCFLAFQNCH